MMKDKAYIIHWKQGFCDYYVERHSSHEYLFRTDCWLKAFLFLTVENAEDFMSKLNHPVLQKYKAQIRTVKLELVEGKDHDN